MTRLVGPGAAAPIRAVPRVSPNLRVPIYVVVEQPPAPKGLTVPEKFAIATGVGSLLIGVLWLLKK